MSLAMSPVQVRILARPMLKRGMSEDDVIDVILDSIARKGDSNTETFGGAVTGLIRGIAGMELSQSELDEHAEQLLEHSKPETWDKVGDVVGAVLKAIHRPMVSKQVKSLANRLEEREATPNRAALAGRLFRRQVITAQGTGQNA